MVHKSITLHTNLGIYFLRETLPPILLQKFFQVSMVSDRNQHAD